MSGTDEYVKSRDKRLAEFKQMEAKNGWSDYQLASNLPDPYDVILVLRELCGLDRPLVAALILSRFPRYPFSPLDKALARRHNSNSEVKNFWVNE